MSNSVLVTVEKDAQKLRIHVDALAQHIKLGWKKVEDEVEDLVEEAEGRPAAPAGGAKAKGTPAGGAKAAAASKTATE